MSQALNIRPVRPSDYAAWLPLWEGYNAFYGRIGSTALSADITRTTWTRFFDAYEPMHACVAESEDSGGLLGMVHYLYHRTTISVSPTCYLQDLFTIEPARGKGVGRGLINAVYERASEAGAARVYWLTHETNQVAMRLYDRIADRSGFIVFRKTL